MQRWAVLLIIVLVLSPLVACSESDDSGQNNQNSHIIVDASLYRDASQQRDAAQQRDAYQHPDVFIPLDSSHQDAGTANGVVGDPCVGPSECGGITGGTVECMTTLLMMLNFNGGYCTASGCSGVSPDPCAAAGGVCVDMMMMSYCFKPCMDATECRQADGYECKELPIMGDGNTYCLPGMGMGFGDGGLPF